MDESWQQLKRLREALDDMEVMWKPFGFGLLWPSPAATVAPAIWELAEERNQPAFSESEPGDLHLRPIGGWLDPTPDRTYCIRWWGDKKGVEAFKTWCEKVCGFFRKHPDSAPELFVPPVKPVLPSWDFRFEPPTWEPPSGYYWTLNAFCTLAAKNPHLTRTKEHPLLQKSDIQRQADVQVITTTRLQFGDGPAEWSAGEISFLELEADAVTFGSRLLDELIADATPPMNVDVGKGVIYVKGVPVDVDRLHARFVAVIVAANGGSVSGTVIRNELDLPEDDRIDRTIWDKLPREVRDQIEPQKGKGYRLRQG